MYPYTSLFKSQSFLANSATHVGIIYVKDAIRDRVAAALYLAALLGE